MAETIGTWCWNKIEDHEVRRFSDLGGVGAFVALETCKAEWNIARMTVVADSKRCVALPSAKPGDCFSVQTFSDGSVYLSKVTSEQAQSASAAIEVREGYSVGVLDQPIDGEALAAALKEFP